MGYYKCFLIPFFAVRCELLGVVPARETVQCYCCSDTYLLDVSHVQDRKKLENITRGYSDRCSYASPSIFLSQYRETKGIQRYFTIFQAEYDSAFEDLHWDSEPIRNSLEKWYLVKCGLWNIWQNETISKTPRVG